MPSRRRSLLGSLGLFLAAILALLLAARWEALAPQGLAPRPDLLLLLLLASVAMILHRPFEGSTLGVGALVAAVVTGIFGTVPAASVGGLAVLLADLLRRFLRRRSPLVAAERRRRRRSLEGASLIVLALLGGGTAARLLVKDAAAPLLRVAVAGAMYGLLVLALRFFVQRLRRTERERTSRENLSTLGLDLAAWSMGLAVVDVASRLSGTVAGALVAGFALLSLEAARHALQHGLSKQRVDDLERLGRATRRMAVSTGEPGFSRVAERLRIECSNVVPFRWFQFELLASDAPYRSWWAGPDRRLSEGAPEIPPSPPPLPGIHRRRTWQVIERSLESTSQRFGRLRLWCDPRQLEDEAVDLLDDLLPQMVGSLEKALLDREAKLDPLTGLALRRVLEERLSSAYRESCKHGEPMAIILCDLDFFKRVNDTYGHAAGDQVLVATAELLRRHGEGEGRLAARYGGEEFVLLLEGIGGGQALAVAETLRREVEALPLEVEGETLNLTLSLGVAVFPELTAKRAQELQELADEALYEAKRHGRNRCLLNLGRGRFQTIRGEILRSPAVDPENDQEAPAPRFFA